MSKIKKMQSKNGIVNSLVGAFCEEAGVKLSKNSLAQLIFRIEYLLGLPYT